MQQKYLRLIEFHAYQLEFPDMDWRTNRLVRIISEYYLIKVLPQIAFRMTRLPASRHAYQLEIPDIDLRTNRLVRIISEYHLIKVLPQIPFD